MIKIQEHLGCCDAEMRDKARNHWERVNPTNPKGAYKKYALAKRVNSALSFIKTAEYSDKFTFGSPADSRLRAKFLSDLCSNNFFLLKKIVLGKPAVLAKIKTDFAHAYGTIFVDREGEKKTFGDYLLKSVFFYKTFRSSNRCLDLLRDIGFADATCVYCNANTVSIANMPDPDKAYVSLDHFFNKAEYPYLALSFYNLIPACYGCNQGDKGSKTFKLSTHLHPHIESFDDWFYFDVENAADLYLNIPNVKIVPRSAGRYSGETIDGDLGITRKYGAVCLSVFVAWASAFRESEARYAADPIAENDFRRSVLATVPQTKDKMLGKLYAKCYRDLLIRAGIAAKAKFNFT